MLDIETTEEGKRLTETRLGKTAWRLWGPYLSERQWGTVREDYSPDGAAWEYFPHDHARSRAYRWGEDGLAGISDEKQRLCFALALWNEQDPIIKERLFGLTGPEGNHGEDVKEYYFYLDNTPTHAYMKHLYKYPQNAFPYQNLVVTNKERNRLQPEYELLDTGIFANDRYFDVFTEYAKHSAEDILIKFTIANRSSESARLYVLPTIWFRNMWQWDEHVEKPCLQVIKKNNQYIIQAKHSELGIYSLYCDHPDEILCTENETNTLRLFKTPNASPYVKDSINDYLIKKCKGGINPQNKGTKASVVHHLVFAPKETKTVKLRLSNVAHLAHPFDEDYDKIFTKRKEEADLFYQHVTPYDLPEDMFHVQRQAFAGLLWNKQCYHYNVNKWLKGDPKEPTPPPQRKSGRNAHWQHLDAYDVFSMPDKWEYPWFASWDLCFHIIPFAMIDPEFAKGQLLLLTKEWYMAPNGQIPAYEWNFSDVNPPVQAWAALRVYEIERSMYGREDRSFLERVFQKLLLNFTWWTNRKDAEGRNIFEGGFLGLDNIDAFNRSLAPPSGGFLEQPDATAWMGMFCINCLEIALELAEKNEVYEDIATKFFEHFVYIADAINSVDGSSEGLWDKTRGFYYGSLIDEHGKVTPLQEDNMIGIIPLFVVGTTTSSICKKFPHYRERFSWFLKNRKDMLHNIADFHEQGINEKILLAFANHTKLLRILEKVLDENQFLSPYGVRSVSKRLQKEPFTIHLGGKEFRLDYEPAESTIPLFGGNSNWRGPIWFPLNFLLIESLQSFDYYYGRDFEIEYPTGSGKKQDLWNISTDLSHRLTKIFLKDEKGRRAVYEGIEKFQTDPHWRDYILFHEYFHGDHGTGLGASNQTGWTGLIAKLIHQYGKYVIQHISPTLIEQEKIGHI